MTNPPSILAPENSMDRELDRLQSMGCKELMPPSYYASTIILSSELLEEIFSKVLQAVQVMGTSGHARVR